MSITALLQNAVSIALFLLQLVIRSDLCFFILFEHFGICYGSYGNGVKWLMMILFIELFSDTYKVAC